MKAALLSPTAMVSNLWGHRQLIRQLLRRELAQRYRGSNLGILWSVLTPLSTLLIYTFVFSTVLKARWRPDQPSATEYALALFAGLIPFGVFSEVVTRSPTLVLGVPNYVKKVVFPLEVLPVVALFSAVVHSLIGVLILLVGTLVLRGTVSPLVVFLPAAYLPLLLICLAAGWFLASLGVYVRDIGQGIPIVVQVLFFLSPVVYPITTVPPRFRPLLEINPMTTVIEFFRALLLWAEGARWGAWAAWTLVSAGMAWAGYVWFLKARKGFADVL